MKLAESDAFCPVNQLVQLPPDPFLYCTMTDATPLVTSELVQLTVNGDELYVESVVTAEVGFTVSIQIYFVFTVS